MKAVLKDAGKLREECKDGFGESGDSQFLKDSIGRAPEQEEESVLVADGAHGGKENRDKAAAIGQRSLPIGRQASSRRTFAL